MESWLAMDGHHDSFYSASMWDFQSLKSVYMLKNGVDDSQETTTKDLDNLYSKIDLSLLK